MKKIVMFILLALISTSVISQAVAVDTINIQSKVFNSQRRVMVALPGNYHSYIDQKYIVAYLFDAQSDDFFNFYKATVNYLVSLGYMNPVILVGIVSDNRQFEFTSKPQTAKGVKYFAKSGGSDLLASYLQDEVMPLIEKKYRCLDYNIGIGHSLGATFVTDCLLRYPKLFNANIAVSPNYIFDQQQLVHKFDSARDYSIFNHKFLYLAHGSGDRMENSFKPATDTVGSMLRARNIPGLRWQFKPLENDDHGLTAMEGIFKGLVVLFRQFTLTEKDSLVDSFYRDSSKPFMEHVKGFYQSVSDWAGLKLPLIDDVNGLGYNCFYTNKKKEALEVFAWGLSLYPDNINLYDSMGELQQKSGNKKEALDYYNRGLKIVQSQRNQLDAATYNGMIAGFENRIKSVNN